MSTDAISTSSPSPESLAVWEYRRGSWTMTTRAVPAEQHWQVWVNGRYWTTLLASPHEPRWLVLGYLANEGLLASRDAVWDIMVRGHAVWVWLAGAPPADLPRVRTTGCAAAWSRGHEPLAPEDGPVLPLPDPGQVLALMRQMARAARGYAASGGLHAAALATPQGDLVYVAEDVGRHNAVDRVRGWALWHAYPLRGMWLLVSGRISSEMVAKARAMGLGLIVSRTAATATALRWARRWRLPVITYARGGRMRLYWPFSRDAAHTQSPTLSSTMTK
ncbi:MAG: formate dehydrogenase accessory sulfurtransferase FdhD [Chloroflexi bacterium]|nr:formate dehydrogenase accessory sulfurtransferase FdhD [Chloroflexota bacterium]